MKKAKRFIVGGLIIAAALTIIIGFGSYIARVPSRYYPEDGYMQVEHKVNGWNMLFFNADDFIFGDFLWAEILGGIICWLVLLTALLTAIFGGLVMAKNSKKFRLTMLIISVILQNFQAFLYMCLGIAVAVVLKINGEIGYTTAFVPFIFVTLFNVAAFVCNFALRDEEKNTALSDNTAA